MQNPRAVNKQTPEDIRAQGWQAEARDSDGHLISCNAPFDSDEDIVRFVKEALGHGDTITIWPVKS